MVTAFFFDMSIVDRFKVILLDMNGTFMFGQDRFGSGENFGATYRDLGGTRLGDEEVERTVRTTYDLMASAEANPARFDDFPQVADAMRLLHPQMPNAERERVEEVMAVHELGYVPDDYADCLRRLALSRRLGLVSNIWSKKDRWLEELKRARVFDLIEFPVFSSDHRSIKPSPVLFELALKEFGVDRHDFVVVGDSLTHDIEGAKRSGLSHVWINPRHSASDCPDHVVPTLLDLC